MRLSLKGVCTHLLSSSIGIVEFAMSFQFVVMQLFNGLILGALYVLLALGLSIIFGTLGIINFAQGGFVMLGAMICVTFFNISVLSEFPPGVRLFLSVMLSIIAVSLIGALMERVTIYPARHSSALTLIIITVGVYTIMWGAALLVWGTDPYQLPAFSTLQQRDEILRFGQVVLNGDTSWILASSTLPKGAKFTGVMIKAQSLWIWGTTAFIFGLTLLLGPAALAKDLAAPPLIRHVANGLVFGVFALFVAAYIIGLFLPFFNMAETVP